MSKHHNPTNAKPGSTRKEMNAEEQEWLKHFNQAFDMNDKKSLEKIMPTNKVITDANRELLDTNNNARRRDVYSNNISVHVVNDPTTPISRDGESLYSPSVEDAFGEILDRDDDHYFIDDETLSPKIKVNRYTADDYAPPSLPTEDLLIIAIDHDRDVAERKKVTQFADFIAKYKKGKGHGKAS